MRLTIPEQSLVVLIGAPGSGKSAFAGRHFSPTEVVSIDFARQLVADDDEDSEAWQDGARTLAFLAERRLRRGLMTVVDAPNSEAEARVGLLEIAARHHAIPAAIVLRAPGSAGADLEALRREGFRWVYDLDSTEAVAAAEIVRQPLWNNRRDDKGPFDVIGDVHGCYRELCTLLEKLGYRIERGAALDTDPPRHFITPPEGRKLIFLGDLVGRGPDIASVLRLVMDSVDSGAALSVPGNHEDKLVRWMRGFPVEGRSGLGETIQQLRATSEPFRTEVEAFLDASPSHYVLDGGALVAAHAGMPEPMQGRGSAEVRQFALYGETGGETDEFGLPDQRWIRSYQGKAKVVYGHTAVLEPEWIHNTINIDTGCIFGGRLTALRYPEMELVSVPAARARG